MSNHSDNNSGLQRLKSNSTTSQDGFGLTGEELKKQISNLLEVIESPTVDAKTLSLSVMQIRSFAKRPTTSFQYSRNTITMDNSSLDKLEISGTPVSIYSGKRDNLTIARHTWNDVNEETFGIIKQHMLSLLFEIRHSHILTVDSAICLYSKTSYPPRQVHVLAADNPGHSPQSYILSTPVLGRPLVWTNIARSITLALHYLHSAPLCLPHGDIQASNIRVNPADGFVKLVDLGLHRIKGDLQELKWERTLPDAHQTFSSFDSITLAANRRRARFLKDERDFGTTMLNLLWLPDEDLSPDWLVENQETPALGWSPPDQTTALGILSPFINAPFGKETRELNQSGAGPFLDASVRLRALSTQFGPQFNLIPNHVADFADRFHCPSQLPNWCVTSVAICCRGPNEFYALLAIEFDGQHAWGSIRRTIISDIAQDTITFSRHRASLHGLEDEVLMSATYKELNLQYLARFFSSLTDNIKGTHPCRAPLAFGLDGWWYVMTVSTAIRQYRTAWETAPTLEWAQRAVASFRDPVPRLIAQAATKYISSQAGGGFRYLSQSLSIHDWTNPIRDPLIPKSPEDAHLDDLQEILDDPHGNLTQEDRHQVLRSIQNLVSQTERLPSCVRTLNVSDYEFKGAGGEASIWSVKLDGKPLIARNALPPRNHDWSSSKGKEIKAAIRREIVSLIQIRHPNVLPILGISSSSGHPLSIITPFASNGNALEFLEELPAERRVDAMLGIVTNIASALDYLHVMDPPIVHGDLHGGNILIDAEGTCLLSDFGLARIKHEKTRSRTTIFEGGRFRYLAPELLADDVHEFRTTPKSDCYAFAMTVLELATLKPPFAEYEDERSVSSAVQSGTRPKRPEQDAFGDLGKAREKMLWTILTKLWAQNPVRRENMHYANIRLADIICQSPSTFSLDIQLPPNW